MPLTIKSIEPSLAAEEDEEEVHVERRKVGPLPGLHPGSSRPAYYTGEGGEGGSF